MTRIKRWLNGMGLKKKFIFYSYVVIIPILLIICGVLISYNYESVQQIRQQNNLNHAQTLSDSIELILSDVNDLSTYIAINQDVNDLLTSNSPQELNKDSRLWKNHTSIKMLEDMIALKGYIKTVAIYPENGVKPYLRCTDSSSYVQTLQQVRQSAVYQDAIEKKGKTTWRFVDRTNNEVYLATRTDKLILYREVYDLSKTEPLGYMVFGIEAEKLEKLCKNVLQDEGEGVVVFNSIGNELVHNGIVNEQVLEYLNSSDYLHQHYRERLPVISCGEYDIFTYNASSSSPIVCKIVPKVTFFELFSEVLYMPLALLLGVLLGLVPVLLFVSNIAIRPLRRVCIAMGKFRKGDFSQQLQVESNDEIGQVAACFNKMVIDIKELIDKNYVMALKEKESELATLQAQINPHFLYNTLDVLYWQAYDAGNEEIAENIYALSQLFRLVLGQGKGIITVAGETELVARYLEIQKMRFSKKMDYRIHIDEEIQNEQIPKLILQPFVENAVVHGIGNAKEHCIITITGVKKENHMEFIIRDTGVGMTEEQIQSIWNKKQEQNGSSYKIGGYAIYNVKERLQLKYHGDFILKIESGEGQGTKITIVIPLGAKEG